LTFTTHGTFLSFPYVPSTFKVHETAKMAAERPELAHMQQIPLNTSNLCKPLDDLLDVREEVAAAAHAGGQGFRYFPTQQFV